ncbi:proline racemase [Lentinula edodes]|nr:proline racemase [Lentinula edodes]
MVRTVELHTSGEPTRIIFSGFPELEGETLLAKRRYASENLATDAVRKWLMLEPRGHEGMYGAILVQDTELTLSGEADIGVLFCHNEGYSTMCGHATIALGRFLVDTHDSEVFPRRSLLQVQKDDDGQTFTVLRLHAPCGVVTVNVPTTLEDKSDATKPVRFQSVTCFVSSPKQGVTVEVPLEMAWPKLIKQNKRQIRMDISYGGAFYALVSSAELGFASLRGSFVHPNEPDIGFLYGITVIDSSILRNGASDQDEKTVTWICFFADEQIDRSPTGSCVSAHVPLAVDQTQLRIGEWCTYQSFMSVQFSGNAFRGRAVEQTETGYVVEIEGFAHYTGTANFIPPQKMMDAIGSGFALKLPS